MVLSAVEKGCLELQAVRVRAVALGRLFEREVRHAQAPPRQESEWRDTRHAEVPRSRLLVPLVCSWSRGDSVPLDASFRPSASGQVGG